MGPAITSRLTLTADTAAEMMTANPISIRENAEIKDAMALFATKGFRAAPVIDESGKPVGVLSQSDIVIHDQVAREGNLTQLDYFQRADLRTSGAESSSRPERKVDRTRVKDLMTPAIFSVRDVTPASNVISQMIALNVHRLFVVDNDDVLVGVISATDVLRHLQVLP